MKISAWQRSLAVAIVTAATTLSLTTVTYAAGDPGSASGKAPYQPSKLYIVQMADMPVVSYTGGISGLSATKPAKGKKIDPLSNDVVRYVGYLTAKHDAALQPSWTPDASANGPDSAT